MKIDIKGLNDILFKKGKKTKKESNKFIDLKGNLNSNNNPFI